MIAVLAAIAGLSVLGLVVMNSMARPWHPRIAALLISLSAGPVGIIVLWRTHALYTAGLAPGILRGIPPVPLSEHLIYGPLSLALGLIAGVALTGFGLLLLRIAILPSRKAD